MRRLHKSLDVERHWTYITPCNGRYNTGRRVDPIRPGITRDIVPVSRDKASLIIEEPEG